MATASEIKVTEAYIGLFGRAPNPEGLAYWVAQLDAAGGTTDALKKLTNDMTLNTEWTEAPGLGANKQADGSIDSDDADAIVAGMYDNLFDRPATAADKEYWGDQLVAGTVTASEMVILLIAAAQEKGNSDSQTLALKEEAASYYAANVDEADFSRETAKASVSSVNSPNSVADSKEATDAISSGVGITFALTAAATDAPAMTGGDDTITGTSDTMQAGDSISDGSTADNDSLTITGDGNVTLGTVKNVEIIDINLSKVTGAGLTVAADNASGGEMSIDVDATVDVAGVDVAGETVVAVTDLASNLTTTDVTDLTVSLDPAAALSISADADAAKVTVTNIDDNDVTITVANNDSTVLLDGTDGAGANDSASVAAVGKSAISLETTEAVEEVTLSGNGGAVAYTVTNAVGLATTYTVAGDQDVTLAGVGTQFTTASFNDVSTAGDTTVKLTGTGDSTDLTNFGVLGGGVEIAGDYLDTTSSTITLAGGNTLKISADQSDATTDLTIDANDSSTTTTMTLDIDNDILGDIVTTDIESLTIDAGNDALSITGALTTGTTAVTYVGLGNLSSVTNIDAGSLDMTTGGLAAATVDATTGAIDITATNDVTVTGAMTANDTVTITADDVTLDSVAQVTAGGTSNLVLTATNDVTVGGVTDFNDITLTGDAVIVSAAMNADNDIVMTATNEVNLTAAVVSDKGDITLSGSYVDATAITATVGDISLTATNDSREAGAQADITDVEATAGSVTLNNGDFDIATTLTAGEQITISGDTKVSVAGGTTTAGDSIIITTNNDVDLGTVDTPSLTSVSTADITATFTSAAALKATTVTTGGGDDVLNLNDADAVFTVVTGDNSGTETITVTLAEDDSSINSGKGDDTVDVVDATIQGLVINTDAGDDTVIIANANQKATVAMGDGSEDKLTLKAAGTYSGLAFSDIEELDISTGVGASIVMTWEQLSSNDSAFKLTGNSDTDVLTLTATSTANTTGDTIDLTNIEANVLGEATISATGGNGNDTITGSVDIANTLVGGAGVDIITGGELADTITGGDGNDTMTGGAGVDTFVSDSADGFVDTITDFGLGSQVDNIDVSADAAVTVTVVADYEDTNTGDIDNEATNADLVFKVANGIDFSADTSTPTAGMTITAAGNTTGSTLKGGGLADIILGSAAADIINAGDGVDIVTGGAGADQITLGSGADVVVYTALTDGSAAVTDATTNFTAASADAVGATFVVGSDKVKIDGALEAALVGTGISNSDTRLDMDATGVYVILTADHQLDADDFYDISDVITNAQLGIDEQGEPLNVDAGDTIIFAIENDAGSETGVYAWTDTNGNGDIDSGDSLALLAVITDGAFTVAEFTFS